MGCGASSAAEGSKPKKVESAPEKKTPPSTAFQVISLAPCNDSTHESIPQPVTNAEATASAVHSVQPDAEAESELDAAAAVIQSAVHSVQPDAEAESELDAAAAVIPSAVHSVQPDVEAELDAAAAVIQSAVHGVQPDDAEAALYT